MKLFITIITLALSLAAQDIPIVQLSVDDAREVKVRHEALVSAQRNWDNLQREIGQRYILINENDPDAGPRFADNMIMEDGNPQPKNKALRKRFTDSVDFVYSKDWKFILPKPTASQPSQCLTVQPVTMQFDGDRRGIMAAPTVDVFPVFPPPQNN